MEIEGEKVEVVMDFLFLGSKITVDGDCSHEIRRQLLLGRTARRGRADESQSIYSWSSISKSSAFVDLTNMDNPRIQNPRIQKVNYSKLGYI